MSKKKADGKSGTKGQPEKQMKPVYPSRKKLKSTIIPREYAEILKRLANAEDRSIAYFVKVAVREYLEKRGELPPKT